MSAGTILVVEDTLESLQLLSTMLDAEGYLVLPADGGELALAALRVRRPDLILLDIRMPGMDGFAVLQHIKTESELADIPVIFLSGVTDAEQRVEGLKRGAVDFITKPFQREELLARVQTQVELQRARSSLRQQADALRETNRCLQGEIAVRQRIEAELRAAKTNAETANIAKSAFLANMSHEIRTPLNAITGMVNIIKRSGATAEQIDRLDKIDAAGRHLLEVINAILDLSKIEAGKFSLEQADVSVASLAANVVSILHDRAAAKSLKLQLETESLPHHLLGDQTRLQQALLNYVHNAIKFTEAGGVTVRVKCTEETADSVLLRFEVQDTGIGIAAEVIPRLFSAFEQADNSTTRQYGGTGLGLAVTKRLAQLMGGDAGASSSPALGSTFWFSARLQKGCSATSAPAEQRSDVEARLHALHQGKTILVVDDDPMNLEVAAMLLENSGLRVDRAGDGEAAVAMASAKDYALILMDMQMPKLDGLQATRQIRALPRAATVPILAMTANAFVDDKQRCLTAGMNDFVTKPYDPDALFVTLLKWLPES